MKDQLYLIKRGDNQFVEETDLVLTTSGGNIGVGSHVPSSKFDVDGQATFKAVNVNDILNIGSNGQVGDVVPQEDDIIVWDGTKWKAGVNAGGIIGGSAVVTSLTGGSSTYTVNFPDTYNAVPAIATDLSIEGAGPIIPYTIANITTSGYDVIFAQPLPNNNYSIHTVFGGNVVLDTGEISGSASDWEAAGLSKIYYVGSVGIGTTSPDYALHVKSSTHLGTALFENDDSTNLGAPDIFLRRSSDTPADDDVLGHLRWQGRKVGNDGVHSTVDYADIYSSIAVAGEAGAGGGAGKLVFRTRQAGGPHNFMVLDEAGRFGIGTTNPDKPLEIAQSDGTSGIRLNYIPSTYPNNYLADIYHDGANGLILESKLGSATIAGDILLAPNGGNVGIGTTSPDGKLEVNSDDFDTLYLNRNSNTGSATIILKNNGDSGGAVQSKHGGGLGFFNRNNSEALTPTMDIDPDGNVGIGTTNPDSYKLNVNGTARVVHSVNGSQEVTSDDRVKHNEQPIVGALETLGKITPKKYIKTTEMYDANHDFELDADGNPIDANGEPVEHRIEAGVIAQQVLTVDELAFAVSPEDVDEDGVVTSPYGLDYNSLFTYAIAAIQEQQQIIDQLKSQNESLAARISALES